MSKSRDAEEVLRWVAGIPLSTIGGLTSITTSMPNRIIEAARRAVAELETEDS